ncbi:MAG: ABC transporter substrate-binding protein [Deltaproteobacteria bacterium]|jgi:branched-chain amino acid transport system substrate-binding protein|nr:ABC transporter substrate-binding protein [Syntrophaceae bacterium]
MKHWKGIIVFSVICLVMSWTFIARAQDIVLGFSGPLSGPAAEYGQDCLFGVDMAVNEINAAGGVVVKGKKHLLKLEKLDDRADPTAAVNNARRFRNNGAIAVYNGVFTTIAAMAKINEEKGNEFLLMAYTSTPKVTQMGNKLLIGLTAPNFLVYVQQFIELAQKKGYKKIAMVATAGSYGEEWRVAFKEQWEKAGGVITTDKPANYYTETDFSAPLTAALATKPDAMLIGGPSATTALVIEQSRSMGFRGGFIVIDQAKLDYMGNLLKGYKLMNNTIGVATPMSVPVPASEPFEKKFKATYKRMVTSECFRHYGATHALAKAIEAAGTTTDVRAIRAAFPRALPIVGDKIPTEIFGIADNGRLLINGSIQTVENGQLTPPVQYFWWIKSDREWEDIKKVSKSKANMVRFESKVGRIE